MAEEIKNTDSALQALKIAVPAVHSHTDENGNVYYHNHTDAHGHNHSHTQTKQVINRLARAIGHLESVKRMVEDGRDCTEVLIQLAAVRAALNNTAKVIIKDHIDHCVSQCGSDPDALNEINDAIDRFL